MQQISSVGNERSGIYELYQQHKQLEAIEMGLDSIFLMRDIYIIPAWSCSQTLAMVNFILMITDNFNHSFNKNLTFFSSVIFNDVNSYPVTHLTHRNKS